MVSRIRRRRGRIAVGVLAGTVILGSVTPAAGGPAVSKRNLSAGTASGATDCATGGDASAFGHEREPTVAINPVDRRNIVVAWEQLAPTASDGSQPTDDVIVADWTKDGGATWHQTVVPG